MTDPHERYCGIRTSGLCNCNVGAMDTHNRCGACRFSVSHLASLRSRLNSGGIAVRASALWEEQKQGGKGYCMMHSLRVSGQTSACHRFEWRPAAVRQDRV